jgi:hypothetical protein
VTRVQQGKARRGINLAPAGFLRQKAALLRVVSRQGFGSERMGRHAPEAFTW